LLNRLAQGEGMDVKLVWRCGRCEEAVPMVGATLGVYCRAGALSIAPGRLVWVVVPQICYSAVRK